MAIFRFEYGNIQIWIWQYSDLNIWQYIFLNGWIPLTGPSGRFDGIWQQRCINDANCGNHQTFQFLRVDFFISDIRSPQHRIWLAMNGIRINKPWPFPKQQGEEGRKSWKKCEMGEGVITLFEELVKVVYVANNYRHYNFCFWSWKEIRRNMCWIQLCDCIHANDDTCRPVANWFLLCIYYKIKVQMTPAGTLRHFILREDLIEYLRFPNPNTNARSQQKLQCDLASSP